MLYLVSHSWFDEYSPTILEGPEVDDWEKYCESLLGHAVERALAKTKSWVGWDKIADGLIEELLDRGYRVAKPSHFQLWRTNIIEGPREDERSLENLDQVVAHNQWVKDRQGKG